MLADEGVDAVRLDPSHEPGDHLRDADRADLLVYDGDAAVALVEVKGSRQQAPGIGAGTRTSGGWAARAPLQVGDLEGDRPWRVSWSTVPRRFQV